MSNNKLDTRRKTLALLGGGLLGASQLPKAWTRPVVNAVILPTHAQTTTDEGAGLPDVTQPPPLPTHFRNDIQFSHPLGSLLSPKSNNILSLLISEAQAGFNVTSGDLAIDSPDGNNFTATCNINTSGALVTLTAAGQVNAGPADLISPACGGLVAGTITVSTITATGAPYSIALSNAIAGNEVSAGTLPEGIGDPVASEYCPLED